MKIKILKMKSEFSFFQILLKMAFVSELDDDDERQAFEVLVLNSKSNILLACAGGTGKTYTIKKLANLLTDKGQKVALTATTGIAAVNLGGSTIYRWAKVGIAREEKHELAEIVMNNTRGKWNWRSTDVLIVDEISLFGAETFSKLNHVAQVVRGNLQPFGGMRVIAVGDFLQLPPIKDDWIWNSNEWDAMNWIPAQFTTPKRYPDEKYFQLLMRVRRGMITPGDIFELEKRVDAYHELQEQIQNSNDKPQIQPTILHSLRNDSNNHNEKELDKLPDDEVIYFAEEEWFPKHPKGPKPNLESFREIMNKQVIPYQLRFKKGAQVLLKSNLDPEGGFVNGSRGVVLECKETSVNVLFRNGKTLEITQKAWDYKDGDGQYVWNQLPLVLAWSQTIHSSQGSTIDYALIDLGSTVFTDGQAYVALSRVRQLDGLFLMEFDPDKIKADPEAVSYMDELFPPKWIVLIIVADEDFEIVNELLDEIPKHSQILSDSKWLNLILDQDSFPHIERETSEFTDPDKLLKFCSDFQVDICYIIANKWTESIYANSITNIKQYKMELALLEAEVQEENNVSSSNWVEDLIKENVKTGWKDILLQCGKDEFSKIAANITLSDSVYPPPEDIFNAFNSFEPDELTVLVMGQDCYHGYGQAHGYAFSVQDRINLPPSLKNIYKEMEADLDIEMNHKSGNLEYLAEQGVLLLNTALTVLEKTPGSHLSYWQTFTDNIIRWIGQNSQKIVFMLWGNPAKAKRKLIKPYEKQQQHLVLEATHPSPLSRVPFKGYNHFSQANEFLREDAIEWSNVL